MNEYKEQRIYWKHYWKEHIYELLEEVQLDQRIEENNKKTLPAYLRYLENPYCDDVE